MNVSSVLVGGFCLPRNFRMALRCETSRQGLTPSPRPEERAKAWNAGRKQRGTRRQINQAKQLAVGYNEHIGKQALHPRDNIDAQEECCHCSTAGRLSTMFQVLARRACRFSKWRDRR
jgi:hypothetical protein